jgi:hypothetical protein
MRSRGNAQGVFTLRPSYYIVAVKTLDLGGLARPELEALKLLLPPGNNAPNRAVNARMLALNASIQRGPKLLKKTLIRRSKAL